MKITSQATGGYCPHKSAGRATPDPPELHQGADMISHRSGGDSWGGHCLLPTPAFPAQHQACWALQRLSPGLFQSKVTSGRWEQQSFHLLGFVLSGKEWGALSGWRTGGAQGVSLGWHSWIQRRPAIQGPPAPGWEQKPVLLPKRWGAVCGPGALESGRGWCCLWCFSWTCPRTSPRSSTRGPCPTRGTALGGSHTKVLAWTWAGAAGFEEGVEKAVQPKQWSFSLAEAVKSLPNVLMCVQTKHDTMLTESGELLAALGWYYLSRRYWTFNVTAGSTVKNYHVFHVLSPICIRNYHILSHDNSQVKCISLKATQLLCTCSYGAMAQLLSWCTSSHSKFIASSHCSTVGLNIKEGR